VANLTLAKTFARQKEIAIRSALGAGRGRIVQQVLAETLALSVTGGGLGLLLAKGATTMITKFLADSLPRSAEVRVDVWVLVFTLGVSVVAGVASGLAPALRLTKTELNESLKQGGGRSESDSGGNRLRSVLVVSEVALSLVLLVGAGLMIRSLWLLRRTNPGWDSSNVVTLNVAVPRTKFQAPSEEVQFFDGVLGRVRALPGVDSAGVIDSLPLSGGSHQPIAIEGRPPVPMSEQPEVDVRLISPGYFHTLHVPLRKGRDLNASDTADRPAVIVISETMARRFWPNEDPIGKHLTLSFFPDQVREVVGIVGDVKLDQLDTDTGSAVLYFPLRQISIPPLGGYRSFPMSLVVRAGPRATSLVPAMISAVHEIDPQTPVTDIASMDDVISNSLSQRRFNMLLLAAFAGLAALLAAVGIYSVLAYAVRRRVREIGIRMALGARAGDVLRMILAEGMTPHGNRDGPRPGGGSRARAAAIGAGRTTEVARGQAKKEVPGFEVLR
jgi:putative ABC transport system permease protein